MKKLSIINENVFDGIGKRSKGGVVRKENYVEYVDLGLPSGTLWATCNLGASSPEEYGDYYAWGETEQKDYYDWDTYKFGEEFNLSEEQLNKLPHLCAGDFSLIKKKIEILENTCTNELIYQYLLKEQEEKDIKESSNIIL